MLIPDQILVHFFSLDDYDPAYLGLLSESEKCKAFRFHFENDRKMAILSKAMLKLWLAAECDLPVSEIEFEYRTKGKPILKNNPRRIFFNIAHSGSIGVFALTLKGEIGIDLEEIPTLVPDLILISESIFTTRELECLRSVTNVERKNLFCRLWVRKEAFSKSLGSGLTFPFNTIDVFDLGIKTFEYRSAIHQVSMQELPAPAGYAAAVCIKLVSNKKDRVSVTCNQFKEVILDACDYV